MAKPTAKDPTGQRTNRRSTNAKFSKRLKIAERKIIAEFRAIPRKRRQQKVNSTLIFYQYDMTSRDLETLQLAIQNYLDASLGTHGDLMPDDWWYRSEIELPYRQGTLQELIDLNQQLEQAIIQGVRVRGFTPTTIDTTGVLLSPRYNDAVRSAQVFDYGLVKKLSTDTANQVFNEITLGAKAGDNPTDIVKRIRERFDVSESNAKRITDTEINRAYNDARLDAQKIASEDSGLKVMSVHLSSQLKTTRPHHLARHRHAYTPEQQTKWWDTGSNRIFCHCSTRSALLDPSGAIIDQELQGMIIT